MNVWIRTADKLPEPNLPILLCTSTYRTVHPGVYVGNNGYHDIWRAANLKTSYTYMLLEDEVSHWMYLPEPPKGDENDE